MNATPNQVEAVKLAKLARLQNRFTRYEVAVINPITGVRLLVAYTERKSRHGLMAVMRYRGAALVALCQSESFAYAGRKASDGLKIGEWIIRFTGRTQRDAIMEGELLMLADAKAGAA